MKDILIQNNICTLVFLMTPSFELLSATSNHQSAKRRGDLFQSSFHNRGGSSNPHIPHTGHPPAIPQPSYSHLNPSSVTTPTSSSSPTPALPSGYLQPSSAHNNNNNGKNYVSLPAHSVSSSSPTCHTHTPAGPYAPSHHWSQHRSDHNTDATADNSNYAVPPPHPRPLHICPEDAPHVSICFSCSLMKCRLVVNLYLV